MTGFQVVVTASSVLFVGGCLRAVQTFLFVRRAIRVRAKVVGAIDATVDNHDASSQSAGVTRYVVELPGAGGRTRRIALAVAFGGAMADRLVGDDQTIRVLYDPRAPDVVRIDAPWTLYFLPAFLCAPGLLFFALSAYVWLGT